MGVMEERKYGIKMTEGSPVRILLRFALPLFLGNLLQQCYNLADLSIAGHLLGDRALSQIGATSALCSLITNASFGLNQGLALSVSRSFGAGDRRKVKESVCWMAVLSGLSALALAAGFLLSRRSLLLALQVPQGLWEGALGYFTIILAGVPLTMAYNLETSLLQAVGDSKTPLLFLFCSSVLNIFLDFLFLGPLGLGVQGAAAATVLAQGASAGMGMAYLWRSFPQLRFGAKELKAPKSFVIKMYWDGLSMALMGTVYNIGSVLLQGSINGLGNVYIAAQVGGRRLAELFQIPGLALGTGMATFSSQNYGAGEGVRIKKGIWAASFLYGVWWLAAVAFVSLAAPQAVRAVTGSGNGEVVANAVLYLKISTWMAPPMAVLVIVRNVLQGMRHTISPLLCSTLELAGKAVFAFSLVPAWGYGAVCICEPVTWVVCFFFILGAAFMHREELKDYVKEGAG